MGYILWDKDFRLLWASGGVDNVCRWMDTIVMSWLVLQLTDSPFQVALLFVLRWLPLLFFALLSGMIADRANRWLVMAVARGSTTLVTAVVLFLVIADLVQPWHILLASLTLGWIYVLEFPSRRSMIYDLVGGGNIVRAMSLETISMTVGRFIGPLAGGLLIQFSGFTGTYVFLIVGYSIAWALIHLMKARIPARAIPSRSFWRNLGEGVKYSLNNRVIRGVLGVTLIMNAMAFSAESLFPVVAKDHLNVGAGLTGVLISAQAIGSLVTATVIVWLGAVTYHGRILSVGVTVQLLCLLFFAISPWYPLSLVMMLMLGLGGAGFSTMQSTIILISATPEMRGTALGVLGQCIGVAALGGLVMGAVANFFGAQVAIAINALVGLLLIAPVIGLSPLVRQPISPPEIDPQIGSGGTVSQASQTPD